MVVPLTIDDEPMLLTISVDNFDTNTIYTTMNELICDHNGDNIVDDTGGTITSVIDATVKAERLTVDPEDLELSAEVD